MSLSPVVLMYHGIDDLEPDRDPENLFVPVQAFTGQLEHLRDAGYRVLSEDEYLAWLDGRPLTQRSVLLTFDDGYRSVLEHAVPLLARHGASAVCYVCTGLPGGRSQWMPQAPWHELMSLDELSRVLDAGLSLGVHGHDHSALHTQGPSELDVQVRGAREALADQLGVWARTFAYPYGYHSPTARQAVSSAGFEAAFAIYDSVGRWALPRVDVNAVDTPRTFRLKLSAIYPTTRRVLSLAPPVRRAVHTLVGRAR